MEVLVARLEQRALAAYTQYTRYAQVMVEPAEVVAEREVTALIYGFGPEHCVDGEAALQHDIRWAGALTDYVADHGYQYLEDHWKADGLDAGCYFTRRKKKKALILTHVFNSPAGREVIQFQLWTNPPGRSHFGISRDPNEFASALATPPGHWGFADGSLQLHDPVLGPVATNRMAVQDVQGMVFRLYDEYSAQEIAEWVGLARIEPNSSALKRLVVSRHDRGVLGAVLDRMVTDPEAGLGAGAYHAFAQTRDTTAKTPSAWVRETLTTQFGVDMRQAAWYDGQPGQYPYGFDQARGELALSFPMTAQRVKVLRVPAPQDAWLIPA